MAGPASSHRPRPGPRRDHRRGAALLTLALVMGGGLWLDRRDTHSASSPATNGPRLPHEAEVSRHFERAVLMLHARQYEHAATALHRVLALAPELPEAHVNMGYALLGLRRAAEAQAFFEAALALRPEQANGYYGLAMALEARGELSAALGAMRAYLHRAQSEDPRHLARARAALWEWEAAREMHR